VSLGPTRTRRAIIKRSRSRLSNSRHPARSRKGRRVVQKRVDGWTKSGRSDVARLQAFAYAVRRPFAGFCFRRRHAWWTSPELPKREQCEGPRFALEHIRIRTYRLELNGVVERFRRSTREALRGATIQNAEQVEMF
jgi:hypothetical protein